MPHPRKHLKLTGDTHPPEVEDDLGVGEEAAAEASQEVIPSRAAAAAMAAVPPGNLRLDEGTERYLDAARSQVRARPLAMLAGAFFAGFAMVVLTRAR